MQEPNLKKRINHKISDRNYKYQTKYPRVNEETRMAIK